jgi:endonuclease YncB( thermonuclease family)
VVFWLAAAGVGLLAASRARVLEGRVVAVKDGDSLEVLAGGERIEVRIFGIDTPERGQPWAERSKRALAARVAGREVRVNRVDLDRYGRTVGEVYADNVCVGCELVREGHAWVFRRYTDDPVLFELEAEARAARRGLWSLPEAQRTPPWEWRAAGREAAADPPAEPAAGCRPKPRCDRLASCAEARRALKACGPQSLDGDGDGIPCEKLCTSLLP